MPGLNARGFGWFCAIAGSALAVLAGGAVTALADSRAVESRTISLVESATLRTSVPSGNAIHEQGEATGTYRCKITVNLRIVSANKVAVSFTVTPPAGTVSGTGTARFATRGAFGYFGGDLSIARGTGRFAHASGKSIGFSGKFNRETFSATVNVHGSVHV